MSKGHVYLNAQGKFAQLDNGTVSWVDTLDKASLVSDRNHLMTKYPELKDCQKLQAWQVTRLELMPVSVA